MTSPLPDDARRAPDDAQFAEELGRLRWWIDYARTWGFTNERTTSISIGLLTRLLAAWDATQLIAADAAKRVAALRACTGVAARWCPVHGECTDSGTDDAAHCDDPACPLHGVDSQHAESVGPAEGATR